MSKSDEIAARAAKYNRIERVADSLGRVIGVRRLKPSQQLKVDEFAGNLSGSDTMTDEKSGISVDVPRRFPLLMAAGVCEIDDVPIPFARNRGELDSILDRLDQEGMAAAVEAFTKLNAESAAPEQSDSDKSTADLAKNLARTPVFGTQ